MTLFSLEAQTLFAKLLQGVVQGEMVSKSRNDNCTVLLLASEPYRGLSETLRQTISHCKSALFPRTSLVAI
jgi:hypothetical protein